MVRVVPSQSCGAGAQWTLTVPTPCDLLECLEMAVTHLWSSTRAFSPLSEILHAKEDIWETWRCWLGCPDSGQQLPEHFLSHTDKTQLGGS